MREGYEAQEQQARGQQQAAPALSGRPAMPKGEKKARMLMAIIHKVAGRLEESARMRDAMDEVLLTGT